MLFEGTGLGNGEQERKRFERYRVHFIAATLPIGFVRVGNHLVRFYSAATKNIHMSLVFVLDPQGQELGIGPSGLTFHQGDEKPGSHRGFPSSTDSSTNSIGSNHANH